MFAARGCLEPVGSVVRREFGGSGNAEVGGNVIGEEDTDAGEATTAVLLEGLSEAGGLKAILLGELGLDDEWT